MQHSTFEEQNNELFKNIINGFHNFYKLSPEQQKKFMILNGPDNASEPILELFITPSCNQNCEYCYLQKYKEGLYPTKINSKAQIIKNLRILLSYYLDNHYYIPRLDLFSGEIFGYPYGNEILDILLEYIDKGLGIGFISLPMNASFCFSDGLIKIMESYIAKFQQRNIYLSLSISYDGPLLDTTTRPVRNNKIQKNEEYLEKLCALMNKYNYGFHPMISPFEIEKQIDNYTEWIKLIKKYFPSDHPLKRYGMIMQLETREQGWTTDKIIEYLKWLRFIIDTDLKEFFGNDIKLFEQYVIYKKDIVTLLKEMNINADGCWRPYIPYVVDKRTMGYLGCSLGKSLSIRLGDLAFCPCHRTSYAKFILGNYEVENEKIIGVKCQNFPLTSAIYVTGFQTKPKCCTCALNDICTKYCIGANFEANQELFYPEESNCELQKAKIIFLYWYYKKLGFADSNILIESYENLKTQEPEGVSKWNSIIQSII